MSLPDLAEQPRTGGMEVHQGDQGLDAAGLEPGPGGVVIVAVLEDHQGLPVGGGGTGCAIGGVPLPAVPRRCRAASGWTCPCGCGPRRGGGGAAGPRISLELPAVVRPTGAPPFTPRAEGRSAREPERSTNGVSSPSPGGCHRAATSRTPRTLRLPNSPAPAGWRFIRGTRGLTPLALNLAPAGWSGRRRPPAPGVPLPAVPRRCRAARRRPAARRRRRCGPPSP